MEAANPRIFIDVLDLEALPSAQINPSSRDERIGQGVGEATKLNCRVTLTRVRGAQPVATMLVGHLPLS